MSKTNDIPPAEWLESILIMLRDIHELLEFLVNLKAKEKETREGEELLGHHTEKEE